MNNINTRPSAVDIHVRDTSIFPPSGPGQPTAILNAANVPESLPIRRGQLPDNAEQRYAKCYKPDPACVHRSTNNENASLSLRTIEVLQQELHKANYDINILEPHERYLYLHILLDGDSEALSLLKNIAVLDDSDNRDMLQLATTGRISITTLTKEYDNEFGRIQHGLIQEINMHNPPLANDFFIFNWLGLNEKKEIVVKIVFPRHSFTGENFYLVLESANNVFKSSTHKKRFFVPLAIMYLSDYLKQTGLTRLNDDVIDESLGSYPLLTNIGKGIMQSLSMLGNTDEHYYPINQNANNGDISYKNNQ